MNIPAPAPQGRGRGGNVQGGGRGGNFQGGGRGGNAQGRGGAGRGGGAAANGPPNAGGGGAGSFAGGAPPPPAAWVNTFNSDWTPADQDLIFNNYPPPNQPPLMPEFPPLPDFPDYHMYQDFYDIANICYNVGLTRNDRRACMAAMVFMRQGAWNIWQMREYVKAQIAIPNAQHDSEIQLWQTKYNVWNQRLSSAAVMQEYNQLVGGGGGVPGAAQGGGNPANPRGGGNQRGRAGPQGGRRAPQRGRGGGPGTGAPLQQANRQVAAV